MNRKDSLALISALSDAYGPSGFEDEAVAAAREAMEDIAEIAQDPLLNLYLSRRENTGGRPVSRIVAMSFCEPRSCS